MLCRYIFNNCMGVCLLDITKFLVLASSTFLTSLSLKSDDSHGVMPTLAAPIIDKVYMLDYYMVDGDDDKRLFWADEGISTIATATIQGSKPANIIDLPLGMCYLFVFRHALHSILHRAVHCELHCTVHCMCYTVC